MFILRPPRDFQQTKKSAGHTSESNCCVDKHAEQYITFGSVFFPRDTAFSFIGHHIERRPLQKVKRFNTTVYTSIVFEKVRSGFGATLIGHSVKSTCNSNPPIFVSFAHTSCQIRLALEPSSLFMTCPLLLSHVQSSLIFSPPQACAVSNTLAPFPVNTLCE